MNKKIKNLSTLAFVLIYISSIVLLKGKLPNQTATVIGVNSDDILSVIYSENEVLELNLNKDLWNIFGQNPNKYNYNDNLVINGTIKNCKKPLFVATYVNSLNLAEYPIIHIVISGNPYLNINLLISSNFKLINLTSWSQMIDDKQDHALTINVKEKIDISISSGILVLNVSCSLITPENTNYYFEIKKLQLWSKMPYRLALNKGQGEILTGDESALFIVEKKTIAFAEKLYPHLQRIYIEYSIDAPVGTIYTIFLANKNGEKILGARIGFLFSHSSLLEKIGTHIDWRQIIILNSAFDPISAFNFLTSNGDFAVIFSPINGSKLQGVQLHKIEFTFSKIEYSQFTIPNISEQVMNAAAAFLLITAGVIPTATLIIISLKYRAVPGNIDGKIMKVIFAGMILRFILAPITAYSEDIQIFSQLGALYFGSGILGAQWVSLPGYVYIQTINYFPYALLRAAGFLDFQFLALAIYAVEAFITKLPSILSDLGSVYLLRKMSQKLLPEKEMLIVGFYMFNPLVIYTSSVLGQFDSIFVFFIILSIYYLTLERNHIKATLSSCCAAIINPVGIATIIPLIVSTIKNREVINTLRNMLIFSAIFSVALIPFIFEVNSPVFRASYQRLMFGIPGESFYGKIFSFCKYGNYISSSVGYGLNFRFLLELLGYEVGSFIYPYGAAVAFLLFIMLFFIRMYKVKTINEHTSLYITSFMLGTVTLFQLTFPTIFDQFVIWVIGLTVVTYVYSSNIKFLWLALIISIGAGFIYIAIYRNYLYLVTGIHKVAFGNPEFVNWATSAIGVLYSALLSAIFVLLIIAWFKKRT